MNVRGLSYNTLMFSIHPGETPKPFTHHRGPLPPGAALSLPLLTNSSHFPFQIYWIMFRVPSIPTGPPHPHTFFLEY